MKTSCERKTIMTFTKADVAESINNHCGFSKTKSTQLVEAIHDRTARGSQRIRTRAALLSLPLRDQERGKP
jgi:hypothetical protein